jgi:hypothetical protein
MADDDPTDADDLATVAARDQLWASLRALRPEIARLAAGAFDATDRERQLVQLLARIVENELAYRASQAF